MARPAWANHRAHQQVSTLQGPTTPAGSQHQQIAVQLVQLVRSNLLNTRFYRPDLAVAQTEDVRMGSQSRGLWNGSGTYQAWRREVLVLPSMVERDRLVLGREVAGHRSLRIGAMRLEEVG